MTPRHFLELDEARTIQSKPFVQAQQVVRDCTAARAIGVVHGVAGLGKTFAVEAALADVDMPVSWVVFGRRPSQTALVKQMFQSVVGVQPTGELYKLSNELRELLSGRPRLIVVDEAQYLTRDVFEFLRYLHDAPETHFGLVFVGGNGCWKVISSYPMLRSRIYREVEVRALAEGEVLDLIPKYHSIHADVPPELLLMINDEYAEGVFRQWASFTKTVVEFCAAKGRPTYDEKLALAALGALPSWRLAA